MKTELTHLIQLQLIDLNIKKMDDELNAGNTDIEKRQSAIDSKKEEIIAATSRIEDNEARRRELEAEVEDEGARVKDRQTKLMNVQTNREYQSLLKEIEDSKKSTKDKEEETMHLMDQAETLQKNIDELNNLVKAEEKLLAEEQGKIDSLEAGIQSKKNKIEKSRVTQAKKIPVTLKNRYEQLRNSRNGIAIVGVTNGVCQGCFMNIPPQQYNEVLRGDDLISCPTCQRMMYFQAEADSE
ncbi:MAG: hypothetical protein H8E41_13865 [Desulfobulbaceae bacterium]|uniref:C4-type zinc ribbon domain-containing protein n=1 Tax=Candidatus Desulfobia pelagia TaxID=2841692 RepID=A0A8J6THB3_9BACT|nr:hypothetical protein [Candidatus Desulfobia pelagia]